MADDKNGKADPAVPANAPMPVVPPVMPNADEPASKEGAPPAHEDMPGKIPEPGAASGAEAHVEEGMAPPGQGAQVVLTGDAQAAARGGTHADIVANTEARDAAIVAGHIEPATQEAAAGAVSGHVDMPKDKHEVDEAHPPAELHN